MTRPGTRFGLVYGAEASSDFESELEFSNIGPVLDSALELAGLKGREIEIENIRFGVYFLMQVYGVSHVGRIVLTGLGINTGNTI